MATGKTNATNPKLTLGTKSITENGTYTATTDGYDGYSQVEVSVSGGGDEIYKYINNNINDKFTIDLGNPLVTTNEFIGYAFRGADSLEKIINIPNNFEFNDYSLYLCSNLNELNFQNNNPVLKVTGLYPISYAYNLSELTYGANSTPLNKITIINSYNAVSVFRSCPLLTNLEIDYYSYGSSSGTIFDGAIGVRFVKMTNPNMSSIYNWAFRNTSLEELDLTIRTSSIITLSSTTAFDGTPGTVYVLVPSSLITTYQSATNWSTLYASGKVVFIGV